MGLYYGNSGVDRSHVVIYDWAQGQLTAALTAIEDRVVVDEQMIRVNGDEHGSPALSIQNRTKSSACDSLLR
jgi:hypothetical protein